MSLSKQEQQELIDAVLKAEQQQEKQEKQEEQERQEKQERQEEQELIDAVLKAEEVYCFSFGCKEHPPLEASIVEYLDTEQEENELMCCLLL